MTPWKLETVKESRKNLNFHFDLQLHPTVLNGTQEILGITAVSDRGSYAKPLWLRCKRYHLTLTTLQYDFCARRNFFLKFANAKAAATGFERGLTRGKRYHTQTQTRALTRSTVGPSFSQIVNTRMSNGCQKIMKLKPKTEFRIFKNFRTNQIVLKFFIPKL